MGLGLSTCYKLHPECSQPEVLLILDRKPKDFQELECNSETHVEEKQPTITGRYFASGADRLQSRHKVTEPLGT